MSIYEEYCSGCGLCHNSGLAEFKEDEKGFIYPTKVSAEMKQFCDRNCPSGPNGVVNSHKSIWGDFLNVYSGYSLNQEIRFKASSGGVITALCCYLLNNNVVDGIIHTTFDPNEPTKTITICSTTCNELVLRCGSRYSISSPLYEINKLVEPLKKYAFVGKPCDVVALRNYMKEDDYINTHIAYLFSFFCAGTPSYNANRNLIDNMGCNYFDLKSLNYRGNGWPGLTIAIDSKGKEYYTDYVTSWMNILGRDIKKVCKFCFDSIGEKADISCGDLWNLTNEGKPDFSENDGVNCIFTWNDKGQSLLNDAQNKGYILLSSLENNLEILGKAQPNHKNRRETMLGKILALKLTKNQTPQYPLRLLFRYARYTSIRKQLGFMKGTLKRIKEKSL